MYLTALRASSDILRSNHFVTLPLPEPIAGIERQVVIVTGSNGGLGFEASKHLLRIGVSKLVMAVRSIEKGEDARRELLKATGCRPEAIEVWELDMCSYDSVKRFAKKAADTLPRLDAVLANAAICTERFSLDEGNERSLTVNVISQCLLLLLLLPKLRDGPSIGRFSLVSSKVHWLVNLRQLRTGKDDERSIFDRLNDPKIADMANRYYLSKLLALYATRGIADAMSASDKKLAVVNAPNPSYCRSGLERENGVWAMRIKYAVLGARSAEMGSRALVNGVLANKDTHGCFLNDCHVEPPGPTVTSEEGQLIQAAFVEELLQKLEAISPGITANI